MVNFIGLNPSTADETKDDPTIRRCIGFAKAWGFTRLVMTNLFAYRSTFPEQMMSERDPIGLDNDSHLKRIAAESGLIICAWGRHGEYMARDADVVKLLEPFKLHCLRLNSDGTPQHPLYLPASTIPVAFRKAEAENLKP